MSTQSCPEPIACSFGGLRSLISCKKSSSIELNRQPGSDQAHSSEDLVALLMVLRSGKTATGPVLPCQVSPIDEKGTAGHERCFVRGEKEDRIGNLLGSA